MNMREGKLSNICVKDDYIKLETHSTIFHLPLTVEILHSSDGKRRRLNELRAGMFFQNYFYGGQHVLIVSENESFFGVISGEYDPATNLIGDELLMRVSDSTKMIGTKLKAGSQVIALCKIMTRSIPPQSTPLTVFVFAQTKNAL